MKLLLPVYDRNSEEIKTITPPSAQPSPNTDAGKPPPATPNHTNAARGLLNSSQPATNSSGLSLVIRCTNEVLKVGDEIPILIIFSNHGTENYTYHRGPHIVNDRLVGYKLTAKTASGETLPDPRAELTNLMQMGGPLWQADTVLHPGDSVSYTTPLNRWALLKEPGRYEVVGAYHDFIVGPYHGDSLPKEKLVTVSPVPISITVLPRTREEMHDYVKNLTNQVAERLATKGDSSKWPYYDSEMHELSVKLMYTCSPEIVPTVFRTMDETSDGVLFNETVLYYLPHTQEIRNAIVERAAKHPSDGNWNYLLQAYDVKNAQMKPEATAKQPSINAKAQEAPPAATNQTNAAPGPVNSSPPAANPSGLSLVIRGPTTPVKQGDEIIIECSVTNLGTQDYQYVPRQTGSMDLPNEFNLVVKTGAGTNLPDAHFRVYKFGFGTSGVGGQHIRFLQPGQSFSQTFTLNRWALIRDPGQYEVSATYTPASFSQKRFAALVATPLKLDVLPRSPEEMAAYVADLTNKIAAHLPVAAADRPALVSLLDKLMYTCRPETVPTFLRIASIGELPGFSANHALLYYVPRSDEARQAILQAVIRGGLKGSFGALLTEYGFSSRRNQSHNSTRAVGIQPGRMAGWREAGRSFL